MAYLSSVRGNASVQLSGSVTDRMLLHAGTETLTHQFIFIHCIVCRHSFTLLTINDI
ncbi:hypothetical protein [Amphritea opalescens]|uniref:hypothetical protein n=1 Tax=Amphritea opalescens TaxID=2490544 RepID=UPI0013DFA026|nr:hypothetical protein [Amphritea opalescens]